jgi:hypothetical protein
MAETPKSNPRRDPETTDEPANVGRREAQHAGPTPFHRPIDPPAPPEKPTPGIDPKPKGEPVVRVRR